MSARRGPQRAAAAARKSYKEPDGADSWDDSDEEEAPKLARGARRKAAARGGASPAARRRGGGGGGGNDAAAVDLHDLTLLEVIVKHSNAVDNAAKEWVARYKADRAAATAELMTLLVMACGCEDADVTQEEVEAGEVDALAQRLAEAVVEEGAGDVFRPGGRPRRGVAQAYCGFWDAALRGLAQAELLFDGWELNDKLTRLVTALSLSTVRQFRYAATLTAAQLVSTWIGISAGLAESRDLAKAQLDAEEARRGSGGGKAGPGGGGGAALLASLRRSVERCHARVEDLRNFRGVMFAGVFSHRFRDVCDSIRCTVIEAIGEWIDALPAEFLGDSHLKYLAWALSDRSPEVRLQAVAALTKLYDTSDHVPRLAEFSRRFTPRFTELMHDCDPAVGAAGLQLLARLVALGIVQAQDVSSSFFLLVYPHPQLRSAAAELAVQLLSEQGRLAMEAAEERLKASEAAAAAAGGGGAKPAKAKKARGKAGAAAAAAAAAAAPSAAEAALATAAAVQDDPERLKLAGLLAVMARLAAVDESAAGGHASLVLSQASQPAAAQQLTLQPPVVMQLVDALWQHMPAVLGDTAALVAELQSDGAAELWGRTGCAHLASLLLASVHIAVFGGSHAKKKTRGRSKNNRAAAVAAAAAGDGGAVDEAGAAWAGPPVADAEAQQAASVVLMAELPALLTKFQAEPHVVTPLVALPKKLRLDAYQLRGAGEDYRALLTQIDGVLQRHSLQALLVEAAGALVYASHAGPAALQEVGTQVLSTAAATAASKLSAAATAVGRLSAAVLAEGVDDLAADPDTAPDALLSLLTALRRVHVLLGAGCESLVGDRQLAKSCQALLQSCLDGRELGPEATSLLLHVSFSRLLWQLRAALEDEAAVAAYLQSRGLVLRLLERLLDTGANEQLLTPQQLLAQRWSSLGTGAGGAGGGAAAARRGVPAELAHQLGVGLPTLQELAVQLLGDLLFLENGSAPAWDGGADGAAAADGPQQRGGGGRAASAPGGPFGALAPGAAALERLWRHACAMLEREGPDADAVGLGEGSDANGSDNAEEDESDADLDELDIEGAAARRKARRAARKDALTAAAVALALLKQRVVTGLCRLLAYRCLPEPGFSTLLAKSLSLLDGFGQHASSTVRNTLQLLRSSGLPSLSASLVAGLSQLYEAAQEAHGDEGALAAAAGGRGAGDRLDKTSWAHVAAVSKGLAGLFQGHNLSQEFLSALLGAGLEWALAEPQSRGSFLLVCLSPLVAKLSPAEAEHHAAELEPAAQRLQQQADEAEQAEEADGEGQALQDATEALAAFLLQLQERAAGKKPSRGALKGAKAAAAAAAAAEAEEEEEDGEQQEQTPAALGRRGHIRFAADVELSDDGSPGDGKGSGSSRKKRQRRGAAPAAKRAKPQQRAKRGADLDEPSYEEAAGEQQQQAVARLRSSPAALPADSGGWHTKQRSSDRSRKRPTPQPAGSQRRGRQQQQQQQSDTAGSEPAEEDEIEEPEAEEEEEEQQQQQQQQQAAKKPRRTAGGATRAQQQAAAGLSPASARKAALRRVDVDAGPLATQTQTQSQGSRGRGRQQQPGALAWPAAAAAASSEQEQDPAGEASDGAASPSLGLGPLGAGGGASLEAHSDELGLPAFFSEEQLPRGGWRRPQPHESGGGGDSSDADADMPDAADGGGGPLQQQQQEASELEEEEEEQQDGSDDGEGGPQQRQQRWGGSESQMTLPSLQVVVDELPEEGKEVDEPPPRARGGRRRRR